MLVNDTPSLQSEYQEVQNQHEEEINISILNETGEIYQNGESFQCNQNNKGSPQIFFSKKPVQKMGKYVPMHKEKHGKQIYDYVFTQTMIEDKSKIMYNKIRCMNDNSSSFKKIRSTMDLAKNTSSKILSFEQNIENYDIKNKGVPSQQESNFFPVGNKFLNNSNDFENSN